MGDSPFQLQPAESCGLCRTPPYDKKAGPGCEGCAAFAKTHYFPMGDGPDDCDLVVVGVSPTAPRLYVLNGVGPSYHAAFRDDGGKVIRAAIAEVQARYGDKPLLVKYLYAVRCTSEHPSKAVITACGSNLRTDLGRVVAARQAIGRKGPLVVLACGVGAVHACGVPAKSEDETLGRIYEGVGDLRLVVVPTRSLAAYAVSSGLYPTLVADTDRAVRVALNKRGQISSRETLEANYVYPQSVPEVRDLVDHVLSYTRGNWRPDQWLISVDTETNTLHPHWSGLKLIMVSFAWDAGYAASVPLWHPGNELYSADEAWPHVKRLLESSKPTTWHNRKYDEKVLVRYGVRLPPARWCSLLGEHALEEDKQGEYGLKALTKRYFPEFSGYEDKLHELLEGDDGAVAVKSGKRTIKLLPILAEALARCVEGKWLSGPGFKPETVEKLLTRKKKPPTGDARRDLELLLAAKRNGEFTGQAEHEKAKKKDQKGGFEKIPLAELGFYACVDVDVTRRLALLQNERMLAEDAKLKHYRAVVRSALANEPPNPHAVKHEVRVLCTDPHPLHTTVRDFKLPLVRELAKMELAGVRVDRQYLDWGSQKLTQVVETTDQKIFELAGEVFNLGSPKQLVKYLFEGGLGYLHPDPQHAEEIARENPEDVRLVGGRVLYRPRHFTAKDAIQTSEKVLKYLVQRYKCPLSNLILARKKAEKARTTVFGNARTLLDMFEDTHLHSGYNPTGTATDRLSSSSGVKGVGFNAQNITKGLIGALRDTRGELVLDAEDNPVFEGVSCKKLFLPDDPSMFFGNADAKGAEVTIFGTYAWPFPGGEKLVEALIEGLDAHCFFASEALNPALVAAGKTGRERKLALARAGVDEDHAWSYADFKNRETLLKQGLGKGKKNDRATWEHAALVEYALRLDKLRDNIKRLVFGMLFGAGVRKIAEIAGIDLALAEKIRDLLFAKFPSIPRYMEETKWELRMFGLVETFHGGRRRFPIDAVNAPKALLARAERQGVNVKIQRTNSQIVLTVLGWIAEILERDMGGRVLNTVHDSIGFQVPKKYAHQIPDLFQEQGTRRVAQTCPWLKSPYRWDVTLGQSYGEQQPVKEILEMLSRTLPEADLDGYTTEEVFDDLRGEDEKNAA